MSVITANPDLASLLNQVKEPSEIRDPSGTLLGFFTPAKNGISPKIPPGAKTTKEVFLHLRTLTDDPARLADLDKHIAELEVRDRECGIKVI